MKHAPATRTPAAEARATRSASKMQRIMRAAIATLAAAAVFATAACTSRTEVGTDATGATEVSRFAIVTPAKESDHGWNQQGLVGAREAAEELGIEVDEHEGVGYDNPDTILTQVATSDNQLVIAHAGGFNTAGHAVGVATGVPTLVVDVENNVPGKVATVIPQPEEGAYLAGVAAAMRTETGVVGIVASAEIENWFLMAGGFAQGVQSVDPAIEIVWATIGPESFEDSAGAVNTTKQVIAAGADVIMGMGNGSTVGYLQAIETADTAYPISYIATVGDVSDIVSNPDTVLTSVKWNFADTYVQAIRDVENGTFGTKTYRLTVKNGGLSLTNSPSMTGDMTKAVDQAREAIINKDITVERTPTRESVQQILSKSNQ